MTAYKGGKKEKLAKGKPLLRRGNLGAKPGEHAIIGPGGRKLMSYTITTGGPLRLNKKVGRYVLLDARAYREFARQSVRPAASSGRPVGLEELSVPSRPRAFFTDKDPPDVVAERLAQAHFALEPGISRIFRLVNGREDKEGEPIKLLEVNENTIPAGIVPVRFGPRPDRGIPYPSIIVEVVPEEFERIQGGELRPPHGWEIGPEIMRTATAHPG